MLDGISIGYLSYMVYNNNDLCIRCEDVDSAPSFITFKNLNKKDYANTKLDIVDAYGANINIDKIEYDFSAQKKDQTIVAAEGFVDTIIRGGRGNDKIYVAGGGYTYVNTIDPSYSKGKGYDTIYADKSRGFNINDYTSSGLSVVGDKYDKLIISGQDCQNLNVFFNVSLSEDGGYVIDNSVLYIGDEYQRSIESRGVGTIEYNGRTYNNASMNQIAENVAGWLESKGLSSTQDVYDETLMNEMLTYYTASDAQVWK